MKKIAVRSAPKIWEKYSSEFAEHLDSGNLDDQYGVFNRFLEEMKFLFHPRVSEDELIKLAAETSKADLRVPAKRKARTIWGKHLLDFSEHERKANTPGMFRIFKKFFRELNALYHPDISEEDLIKIAEDVMGKPDMGSAEGCMAELLLDDDDYIGMLEPSPDKSKDDDSWVMSLDQPKDDEEADDEEEDDDAGKIFSDQPEDDEEEADEVATLEAESTPPEQPEDDKEADEEEATDKETAGDAWEISLEQPEVDEVATVEAESIPPEQPEDDKKADEEKAAGEVTDDDEPDDEEVTDEEADDDSGVIFFELMEVDGKSNGGAGETSPDPQDDEDAELEG